MTQYIKSIMCLFVTIIAVGACDKTYLSNVGDKESTLLISLDKSNVYAYDITLANISYVNNEVALLASGPWEILSGNTEDGTAWCGFYSDNSLAERVMEGPGSSMLSFYMKKNDGTETRTAEFVFGLKGTEVTKTFTVTQEQSPATLEFKRTGVTLTSESQEFELEAEANVPYSVMVESDGDWITENGGTIDGTQVKLKFTASENTTSEMRTAVVKLYNDDFNLSSTIEIQQYYEVKELTITDNFYDETVAENPESFRNVIYWTAEAYPEYKSVKIKVESGGNVDEYEEEAPAGLSLDLREWVDSHILTYVEGASLNVTVSLLDAEGKARALGQRTVHPYFASGTGTPEDPYVIANYGQLDNVRRFMTASYRLDRDIDISKAVPLPVKYEAGTFIGSTTFLPVGMNAQGSGNNPFKGVFDGNGKSISGFIISETEDNGNAKGVGLFAALAGADPSARAVIKNLKVYGEFNIHGVKFVGGIVGKAQNYCDISNCENHISITSDTKIAGNLAGIGGIVGMAGVVSNNNTYTPPNNINPISSISDINISGCRNYGTIKCDNGLIGFGGIAGASLGTMSRCENYGEITLAGSGQRIGGIVGEFIGKTLVESCNYANVSGFGNVGGVVGMALLSSMVSEDAEISDCYNQGNIHSVKNSGPGGICANAVYANKTCYYKFTNCYNSGKLTLTEASINKGAITGDGYEEVADICIYSCYGLNYDGFDGHLTLAKQDASSGMKTADEMKSQETFAGWDFSGIWKMGTDFPEFQWID